MSNFKVWKTLEKLHSSAAPISEIQKRSPLQILTHFSKACGIFMHEKRTYDTMGENSSFSFTCYVKIVSLYDFKLD